MSIREASIVYNVVDDCYYVYKGEDYYFDSRDRVAAMNRFRIACNDLFDQHKSGVTT